uniref:Uncharacterized protein n=1 Tax=Romanomermis culicivorax TaxID=13658 RepID=A0A915HW98_ROMCU
MLSGVLRQRPLGWYCRKRSKPVLRQFRSKVGLTL